MAPYSATVFLGIHTNGIKRDKVEHLCSLTRDLINSSPTWLNFVLNSFNDKSETVLRGQREQGMEFTTLELEFEIVKHINRSNKAFVYDAWRILLDSAIGVEADKYSFNHVVVFTDDEDSGSIQIDLPSLIKHTVAVLNPSLHFTFIKAGEDRVIGSKLRENCSSEFCHAINVEDSTQGWNKAFELLRHRIMLQLDAADLQFKTKTAFSDPPAPADLAEKFGTLKIDEAPSESNTSDSDDADVHSSNGKQKPRVATKKLGLFSPLLTPEEPSTVSDNSFETARPETERDRNPSAETEQRANSTLPSIKTIPGRRIVGKPISPEVMAKLKPTFENSWDKPMANGRCPTFRIESSLFTLRAGEEGPSGDGETSCRPVSNVNGNTFYGPSTSRAQYERAEGPPPPREGYNGNSAFQGRGAFRANETLGFDCTQQSWRTMPRNQESQHFRIRIERIPFTTTNEEIQSIFQQWGNCAVDKSGTTSSYRWVQLNYSTLKESRAAIKFGANVHVEGSKLIIFIL